MSNRKQALSNKGRPQSARARNRNKPNKSPREENCGLEPKKDAPLHIAFDEIDGAIKRQFARPDDIRHRNVHFWMFHHDPIVRLTGWITIFTAALTIVGSIQAWAYIQRERAAISVRQLGISTGQIVAGREFYFFVTLRNNGGLEATPTAFFIASRLDQPPARKNFLPGRSVPPYLTIPPNEESEQRYWLPRIDGKNVKFTEEQAQLLNSGRLRFFIYGEVQYTDRFTIWPLQPFSTQFCYEYAPTLGGPNNPFVLCSASEAV